MTVLSTIHLLNGSYPPADSYCEIAQTYVIPGGEAANAAIVLQNLGVSTQLDGCFFGQQTDQPLRQALSARGVDHTLMPYQADFPGWRDLVLCDGESRTIFGWFGEYLFGGRKLWTDPSAEAVRLSQAVALDPFFVGASAQVAELCRQFGKPYVTVDCKWDDPIAQHARAIIISKEFLDRDYPGADFSQLYEQYRRACRGLVIFTWGSKPLWYAAPGGESKTFAPYSVKVVDTLAAGDSFRAGIVYGVVKNLGDDATIRFASALAAVVCTRFPSVYQPPSLAEIEALL
jgi:sugar/nucleoside kinase (ribokinase family)